MSLTRDYVLKHHGLCDGQLKGFGGARAKDLGIGYLQVWHGGKPYPVNFKIHSHGYLTIIGGDHFFKTCLGLITFYDAITQQSDNTTVSQWPSLTSQPAQKDPPIVHSFEDLEYLHPNI